MNVKPIPDDCLPDAETIRQLLRGPEIAEDGTIKGGVYAGMTPEQVLADRDAYNRACGE